MILQNEAHRRDGCWLVIVATYRVEWRLTRRGGIARPGFSIATEKCAEVANLGRFRKGGWKRGNTALVGAALGGRRCCNRNRRAGGVSLSALSIGKTAARGLQRAVAFTKTKEPLAITQLVLAILD